MDTLFVQIKERRFLSPLQQPYYVVLNPPPPPFVASSAFNLNNKVNPSILLIIVILAIIFFISGLLHLVVRFLLRPQNRDPDEIDNVTVLQGQLQQLFHLHDAGVDQSFIDALPVFNYKAIIGVKDPFDCAVCLCEFESEDKLRLLPKCSHAFHMECIDTWLLSHSTCPLCRASLLSDFPTNCSPIVLVLEAGSESSREIAPSDVEDVEDSMRVLDLGHKSIENNVQTTKDQLDPKGERVVPIKLGKFKNVDGVGAGSEGSSDATPDARRCFSMGSFAYVMDESSSLQVPIRTATPLKKPSVKKPPLPLTPGHCLAMSECGCDSKREFEIQTCSPPSSVGRLPTKKESFSVSKIWLTGKKDSKANSAAMESSRRAFSFRFPIHRNNAPAGRRTASEINLSSNWEVESCNSLDSQPNAPSFARRTLLWLMGKPNKVVHSSSFSGNVV